MRALKDCRYSAFISYAQADDQATDGWISQFSELLRVRLQNRLGRIGVNQLQDMHLSGRDGPVMGSLPDALLSNVADSYAMIIVVFNAYAKSDWCLQELEHFRKSFGAEGLQQRLYVVALSKSAMDDIVARPDWARLTLPNQLWIPFYSDEDEDKPAPVRLDHGGLSQRFEGQLVKLVEVFVDAAKQDLRQPPQRAPAPPLARPRTGGLLFGVPSPELAEASAALARQLRQRGMAVEELGAESLDGDFAEFDRASLLVLPFSKGGQHLKPFKFSPGGHLAAQRDAWLGKGGEADKLVWLDLRETPIDAPPGNGLEELVASIEAQALRPEALLERYAPTSARDAPPSLGSSGERADAAVFCPAMVGRASVFLVQVLLHAPDRAVEAREQALEADATAQRRGVLALSAELPFGTRLDLHLEVPSLRVDEPDAVVVWVGRTTAAQFEVAVPAEAVIGNVIGRVRLSVAGVPIGTLRFQFTVAAAPAAGASQDALVEVTRYRRAFVSYSSSDRAEVLRRVQAFRIAGVSVFQDALDLEPGQRWERKLYREIDRSDVVLLFWSTAAAASPWVAREIDYALKLKQDRELKQGRDDEPPDIAPVPIEGPPIPAPPERLRHLHFNDALLAHIAAAQVPPMR